LVSFISFADTLSNRENKITSHWTIFRDLTANLKEGVFYITKSVPDTKNPGISSVYTYRVRLLTMDNTIIYYDLSEKRNKKVKKEWVLYLNERYLNNYKGAIADYTEAIKLRPDYYKAYNNRGFAKLQIDDYAGAILDFTQKIKYDNYNTEFTNMVLGNRSIAKLSLGQDGCPDLKKAIELGNKNVIQAYNELCK
jgi:tetratricopeptide (TPR) repeat protein